MSYSCSDGDPVDVYDERRVKARKPHRCDACREEIAPGHTYWRVSIVWDRTAETVRRCERCQALHLHLRGLGRSRGTWPDEQLACGQSYEDEWGDVPPEIAALAFATPAEAQRIGGGR